MLYHPLINNRAKFGKGFTLLEILVVCALIGIFAAISLTVFSEIRAQARDAQRLQDLRAIALAFELYYIDHGHFPIEADIDGAGLVNNPNGNGKIGNGVIGAGNQIDTLLAPYISTIPRDPRHGDPLPGADPDNEVERYYYYYDGYHQCKSNNVGGSELEVVVYAKGMERQRNANRSRLCTQSDIEMHMQNNYAFGPSPAHYIILSDRQHIGNP